MHLWDNDKNTQDTFAIAGVSGLQVLLSVHAPTYVQLELLIDELPASLSFYEPNFDIIFAIVSAVIDYNR